MFQFPYDIKKVSFSILSQYFLEKTKITSKLANKPQTFTPHENKILTMILKLHTQDSTHIASPHNHFLLRCAAHTVSIFYGGGMKRKSDSINQKATVDVLSDVWLIDAYAGAGIE